MSEMIERIADAIAESVEGELARVLNYYGPATRRKTLEPAARAAIKAMMEPTEKMVKAVDAAAHDHWPNARKMANGMMQAMLTAALEE